MLARISLSTSNLDGARVAPNRGIPSRTRPCTSSCLERFPLRGHPRIPVHHAQELPIGGKLPSYFLLKSLTQSFPLEWRDVLRYQRLRKLHADLHAANCAPLRDPFGADPARLLGRGGRRRGHDVVLRALDDRVELAALALGHATSPSIPSTGPRSWPKGCRTRSQSSRWPNAARCSTRRSVLHEQDRRGARTPPTPSTSPRPSRRTSARWPRRRSPRYRI